jgi:hypothetical protein
MQMRFQSSKPGRSVYGSRQEATADRAALRELAHALDATGSSLSRDDCRQWWIWGSRGRICSDGAVGSWTLVIECETAREWSAVERSLSFCITGQNGDSEGNFRLDGLPTPEQAAAIRKALGLRKRRSVTQETLERLRR